MARALLLSLFLSAAAAGAPLPSPLPGRAGAVVELLSRVLSVEARNLFSVALSPSAGACCSVGGGGDAGLVTLTASSAVDAAYCARRYLAATLNASFSLESTGGVQVAANLSAPLPAPAPGATRFCRATPYTYLYNVVQYSYSNVWFSEVDWRAEVDWAALHGVNLALAYGGQEELFRRVYTSLGLNDSTLGAFFDGPAFLAWSRGQGMAGVAGPLPTWWYGSQLELNQAVVGMMTDIGIAPILPVFQGNVPLALRASFPAANISDEGWLDVYDPLFSRIADLYMSQLLSAYPGLESHFFEGDGLFSSGTPPWAAPALAPAPAAPGTAPPAVGGAVPPDPDALARSRAAYASFARHDAAAVWVYQSWIWRGMSSASDLAYATGWLAGAPPGRMLLLDQTAERIPIWSKFDNFSFGGQPFAWLSMNNMGGNVGMVGSFDAVSSGVAAALASGGGALAAVGIDPEGIAQNPAYTEFSLDAAFDAAARDAPSAAAYLADWGERRCGVRDAETRAAWSLLAATVYRANQTNFEHHLAYCTVALPLGGDSWNSPVIRPGFAAAPLAEAWRLLIAAAPRCRGTAHLHDLVDVGREFLSLFPCLSHLDAVVAAGAPADLAAAAAALDATLRDIDALLATRREFRIGAWIAAARALGARASAPPGDLDLLEWNARTQVSTWRPMPAPMRSLGGLNDYANKQWQGLVADYYRRRYALFAQLRADALRAGGPVNATAWLYGLTDLGAEWTHSTTPAYSPEPVGDPLAVSSALFDKYARTSLPLPRGGGSGGGGGLID